MNKLTKVNNGVKWILSTPQYGRIKQVSEIFAFQNRKCTFVFRSGYNNGNGGVGDEPITLSIDFQEKEKNNPAVNVTIQASKASKIFYLQKVSVTGAHEQVIWISFDFNLRSSDLTFEMVIQDDILKSDKSIQTPPYLDAWFSLESSSKDFAKLLNDGPNHDVEFAIGEQTIKAHKSILCCRSDVFTSMLQSDMVEGKTGRVNIQDMDAKVFQQFLQCLYTGNLPDLTVDIAMQLYTASDKYAVDTLKLQFAHFLIDNLSLENACEILVLADRHNDPDFKKVVMEYIFKEKIPVGEKWPDFCKEHQQLAMEVLNSFCRYLCQK